MSAKEVESWKKRTKKKMLNAVKYEIKRYGYMVPSKRDENGFCIPQSGFSYQVMFQEKSTGFIKYAIFNDGMYCRYGMKTIAILKGPSLLDLWQSIPGCISEDEAGAMIEFIDTGTIPYPEFDLDILKDLVH